MSLASVEFERIKRNGFAVFDLFTVVICVCKEFNVVRRTREVTSQIVHGDVVFDVRNDRIFVNGLAQTDEILGFELDFFLCNDQLR